MAESGTDEAGMLTKALDKIWEVVIYNDSRLRPDKSCYELYMEYKSGGQSIDECVENLIRWQMAKTGAAGFALGLPGLASLPLTIPADLTSSMYIQLRMVAVIGLLYGWDAKSDRLKTLAFVSLLGSSAGEVLREAGVAIGTKVSAKLIGKIPGKLLIEINKKVGFRLLTKAGQTGVINLMKIVPIVGGIAGGGVNAYATKQIGYAAKALLKDGPAPADTDTATAEAEE